MTHGYCLYLFQINQGRLLSISPANHFCTDTFCSEFSHIDVWFTNQHSRCLEISDRKIDFDYYGWGYREIFNWTERLNLCHKYGILFFTKNKLQGNMEKHLSKDLSSKYRQKRLFTTNKFATSTFKTLLKWVIQKTVEAAGNIRLDIRLEIRLQKKITKNAVMNTDKHPRKYTATRK